MELGFIRQGQEENATLVYVKSLGNIIITKYIAAKVKHIFSKTGTLKNI